MVAASQVIEVEVAGPNGRRLHFTPAGRPVRGLLDFASAQTKSALSLRDRWKTPIPGQVLGVDVGTGDKYIREPLHEPKYATLRQVIAKRSLSLAPEREDFESETTESWLYWMRRAVDSGLARVIKGELPPLDSFPANVKKDFIFAPPPPTANDRLAATLGSLAKAIDANTAVLAELIKGLKK